MVEMEMEMVRADYFQLEMEMEMVFKILKFLFRHLQTKLKM